MNTPVLLKLYFATLGGAQQVTFHVYNLENRKNTTCFQVNIDRAGFRFKSVGSSELCETKLKKS